MRKLLWILGMLIGAGVAVIAVYVAGREPQPVPTGNKVAAPTPAEARPPGNPLRNAYFGETHLHTRYSLDANLFGTVGDPRMAYRFAQGEPVVIPGAGGLTRKIVAPLDFAAVTDHAESIGMYAQCNAPDSDGYWSIDCIGMRYQILLVFPRLFGNNLQNGAVHARYSAGACGGNEGPTCIRAAKNVWQDTINAANEHYRPGAFTTLVGFEYSPTLNQGGMIHRNVLFRGDDVPDNVFGAGDGFADDLLRWLDVNCTGSCNALSIPHNPNFSWGLMFGDTNADASPLTRDTLILRAKYETLIEIFQAKGSSECARGVANNDEECSFENLWPACTEEQANVDSANGQHLPRCVTANDMLRSVLRKGLAEQLKWGFNPYKFGFVGGTDNHNGTPGDTTESTYQGHGGANDVTPAQRLGLEPTTVSRTLGFSGDALNPGGLTGVWAEENTREAVFDALERRESWGTSGTRIRVRLFGGYGWPPDLANDAQMLQTAYAAGVPMGGDLAPAPADSAPTLLVWAMRDANSAPLQRVQIVKGWLHGSATDERVYDVVCANGLTPDINTDRCPDHGATVDLADCSYSANPGATELAAVWTDPAFDPADAAFYYARVLENPTCRYTQFDALKLGVALPEGIPATVQERAWSSPIWYSPQHAAVQ